jgi:hypothetical protein
MCISQTRAGSSFQQNLESFFVPILALRCALIDRNFG